MLPTSAVPLNLRFVASVAKSVPDDPVSGLIDVSTGDDGAEVNRLKANGVVGDPVLPARSVALAVTITAPPDPPNPGPVTVRLQLPLASAIAVPSDCGCAVPV